MNAAQSQLNSRTRATMARIAELSMMKAQLLDSERERTKLQEELEDAYHRLEKGTILFTKLYLLGILYTGTSKLAFKHLFRSCSYA